MWLSRRGLVVAAFAVALGFAPATANATRIEQAVRVKATIPTERAATEIGLAMRIADTLVPAGHAQLLLDATDASGRCNDPAGGGLETVDLGCRASRSEDRLSVHLMLSASERDTSAAKLEMRDNKNVAVNLQLQARADTDQRDSK